MKRRGFLKFLGAGAGGVAGYALAPKQIPQQPALPAQPLPTVGQEAMFVEDVFETEPEYVGLQSRGAAVAAGTRLIRKRWNGKRWEQIEVVGEYVSRRYHG